jgi:1-acyl-sn-glycerol-3-phosphate acyltransferase
VAPGERGRYGIGGARLAVEAGVPVVPVAHNAGEVWPKNAFLKCPGLITVSIGPTIDSHGRSAAEITREAEAWIEAEMARLPHAAGDQ